MGALQSGDALGSGYRLIERIGAGAVGEVWRVSQERGGLDRAAKLLRAEHAQDPELVERFIKERSVLLGLQHPNIVPVRDLVVEGEQLAIVMELVETGSLRQKLEQQKTLPAGEAIVLMRQVFEALDAAHRQRITHRDIKPDNILIDHGNAMITDFGIASVMQGAKKNTSGMLGTPAYMPPELFTRGETGTAGDIYSAGIMFYELLSGRTPFTGSGNDYTVSFRHVSAQVPAIEVPEELWSLIESFLAKSPESRPDAQTAAQRLEKLGSKYSSVAALPFHDDPIDFQELERPATVVKSLSASQTAPPQRNNAGNDDSPLPDLGTPTNQTVVKPLPRQELQSDTDITGTEDAAFKRPGWLTNKALLLIGAVVLLIAAMIIGFILIPGQSRSSDGAAEAFKAAQRDQVLPSGLGISRQAVYDPQSQQVELTLSYTSQKSALSGELFESLPGLDEESACPNVTWTDVAAARNQQSLNGISASCGWQVKDIDIAEQATRQVKAEVQMAVPDQEALEKWLERVGQETTQTMQDKESASTAYPVQRLQKIQLQAPERTVSQTPLPLKLIPVWPSGPDSLNPIYASPATGKPTSVLQAVSGGEQGVRFSDACSGALAVSKDGLVVTALSVSPQCTVRATVGNFTDLVSNTFSITTR